MRETALATGASSGSASRLRPRPSLGHPRPGHPLVHTRHPPLASRDPAPGHGAPLPAALAVTCLVRAPHRRVSSPAPPLCTDNPADVGTNRRSWGVGTRVDHL